MEFQIGEAPESCLMHSPNKEVKQLRIDMDETLRDQNDINESTRAQLDAISTALAELQAKPSETKTRKPIGFIQPENSDEEI